MSANCPCDSCERTLATEAARPQAHGIGFEPAPQFTYAQEFYGWPQGDADTQAQTPRAPPVYSFQRIRVLGSRITSKLHHWTSAVWPL